MSPRRKPPTDLPTHKAETVAPPVPVAERADTHGAFRDAQAEGLAFVRSPTVALSAGTVATSLPTRRAKSKYDWVAVRGLLEDNPGLWVLSLNGVSSGMYSWVRRGGPEAFIGMGGHLQVSLRNQKPTENSKGKNGDLWLRWIPEGWTEQDQARAEAAHAAGEGVL